MTRPSITPRIYYSTYLRFRKNFKAHRGETMASYFERLSKWIEDPRRWQSPEDEGDEYET